jgi:hypothetical protein
VQGDVLLQYAEGGGMTIVTKQGLEAATGGGSTALLEVPDVAQAKALRAALPGALLLFVSSPDELEASLAQVRPGGGSSVYACRDRSAEHHGGMLG